jgi:hypothetical protein
MKEGHERGERRRGRKEGNERIRLLEKCPSPCRALAKALAPPFQSVCIPSPPLLFRSFLLYMSLSVSDSAPPPTRCLIFAGRSENEGVAPASEVRRYRASARKSLCRDRSNIERDLFHCARCWMLARLKNGLKRPRLVRSKRDSNKYDCMYKRAECTHVKSEGVILYPLSKNCELARQKSGSD